MWSACVMCLLCVLLLGTGLPPRGVMMTATPPVTLVPVAPPDIVAGQLVIGFAPESDEATRDRLVAARGGVTLMRLVGVGARVVTSRAGRPLGEEARAYAATAGVRYVEPHYRYHTARVPDDTRHTDAGLWGLATIGAPAAWDRTTGDRGIVVGVVDSGIDYRHVDLAANMWSARMGWSLNGCPSGTHGYRAVGATVDCDPLDTLGSGTQIAGTIGAVGDNNLGVAGVNWQVSLMALACMDASGNVNVADAVRVLDYAIAARRDGVNLRVLVVGWGSYNPSETLRAAIAEAGTVGILVVAPAGDNANDNDQTPYYPASYGSAPANLPNVIAVAATSKSDGRLTNGNVGATSVHLGAPGGVPSSRSSPDTRNLSTVPNDGYGFYGQSEAAAAHVAGSAALLLAAEPTLTVAALRGRLLACGTPLDSLSGLTLTGRRLNVANAVGNTGCDYRLTLEIPSRGGTISATPANPTSVSGSITTITAASGSSITLTATPYTGYRFVGWEIDGVVAGAGNPLALTVTADQRIVAGFDRVYTVTVGTSGGGTATLTPSKATYAAGKTINVTATSDAGYRFSGWTLDAQPVSVEPHYSFIVTSDHRIVAGFVLLTAPTVTPTVIGSPGSTPVPTARPLYALALSAGAGGAVSALPGPGPYAPGTRVQASAVPESGFVFTGWTLDGVAVGAANPYTVVMSAERSIVATFARAHPLTIATTSGGRVDTAVVGWSAGAPYPTGTIVTLTAVTASNAVFTGWTVDGTFGGWPTGLKLTMDAPHSVLATFAARPRFGDLPPGPGAYEAIAQLAARDIVHGYQNGDFGQYDTTLRVQMAALIGRAMGWEGEEHGNPFSDRGAVDDELWRAVGTLAHYEVARGYGDGTYGTLDPVLQVQTVAFITRAMVRRGLWVWQPDDAALFPAIPASSGHRVDFATYVHYVGPPPDSDRSGDWVTWDTPATRGWFARALWQTLDGTFGTPRIP